MSEQKTMPVRVDRRIYRLLQKRKAVCGVSIKKQIEFAVEKYIQK